MPVQFAFMVLLSVGSIVYAQAQPAAAPRWNVGLKLGTGASYSSFSSGLPHPWTAYTGGLSAGYSFKAASTFFTLQADALLERRESRPWQLVSATNAVLFVPFYLRTERPAARVHLLLGGGPSYWLLGNTVPDVLALAYTSRQIEATGFAGFEVRLLPLSRYETTVALSYRRSFTLEFVHYRQSTIGSHYEESATHSWLGATLNLYFHPAAQP